MKSPGTHKRTREEGSRNRRRTELVLAIVLILGLPLLAEAATRVILRVQSGQWAQTREATTYRDRLVSSQVLFRRHPYLDIAPRESGRFEIRRETMTAVGEDDPLAVSMSFNSHGYRSPERPVEKPDGVFRILCAGGSTTMDTLAFVDEQSWPWLLEEELRGRGLEAEVWNAGVPGWTSLESLVSLAIRDLELEPDLVLLYQGINDMQPGAREPFDVDYERGHPEILRRALGFGGEPPGLLGRSLLLEVLRDRLSGPPERAPLHDADDPAPVRKTLPAAAVAAYERNLRSFIAVAETHGAETMLLTSALKVRTEHRDEDLAYIGWWLPWLEPNAAVRELDKLNGVVRELGAEGRALVADLEADVGWRDEDFGDPMHVTSRDRFVAYLADRILAAAERNGVAQAADSVATSTATKGSADAPEVASAPSNEGRTEASEDA
ncbi:MAG: GDSL-type esterase/lipase family protein [Acidobacteriota bacterium]